MRRSAAAAGRFQTALETAIDEIARTPDRWPTYLNGTRYRALRRFPFIVVYRRRDSWLQIVGAAHARKRPGYWRRRASNVD